MLKWNYVSAGCRTPGDQQGLMHCEREAHGEAGSPARFDVLFFRFFISEETTVMLFLSNMDFEVLFPKCDKSMHFRE